MISLVGYTGFVGSNLLSEGKFDNIYNSKNIKEAYGTNPDLLVYAGIRAEKYLANKFPEKDLASINEAFEIIQKINPKKLVLISTIDVYNNPIEVNELSNIDTMELQPYGYNRHKLEEMVHEVYPDALIVRLPGLYGNNIKKNFLYDLIQFIPSMLTNTKMEQLLLIDPSLSNYYTDNQNGFYKVNELKQDSRKKLKEMFDSLGFSALNFTDSRGVFQFYNLKYLWNHINIALQHELRFLNLATEPVCISEIYYAIKGNVFTNEITTTIPKYDFRTIHDNLFDGASGYIFNKEFVLNDIRSFVLSQMNEEK